MRLISPTCFNRLRKAIQSMRGNGNCYDNAMAESLFNALKQD